MSYARQKKEISKGRIMRVLDYKILRFANILNISIKDQKDDTVIDAFVGTNKGVFVDCINKNFLYLHLSHLKDGRCGSRHLL